MNSIPITILTGFLGSGKTTLLNRIINENPDKKFGLIINEFGEVGIDGQLVENSGEELVEMSNGCLCCIVRSDLLKTVEKIADSKKVDYILIETSGLAEPRPIADTFVMNDLNGKISLDAIVCLIDSENFAETSKKYEVVKEQLVFNDILVLNKINNKSREIADKIKKEISKLNPHSIILENSDIEPVNTKLLIETGKWTIDKLIEPNSEKKVEEEDHHEHSHHHDHDHHHEHDDVDEVVFKTEKVLDPNKLDDWLQNKFPQNVVRAKGILNIQTGSGIKSFVFQMIGASKMLTPFAEVRPDVNLDFSRMVLIGKGLDKWQITEDLSKTTI